MRSVGSSPSDMSSRNVAVSPTHKRPVLALALLSGLILALVLATGNAHAANIAVGANGKIIGSPDGATWTPRTSGSSANLNAVAYGNGQWVAVGDGGVILTSPNGATWTSRTSGVSTPLRGVAYGGGLWIAVGDSSAKTFLRSTDGITWVATYQDSSLCQYGAVAYDATATTSKWVAVGSSKCLKSNLFAGLVHSLDGVSWTLETNSVFSNKMHGVSYGGGLWTAVGESATGPSIYTSNDGVKWAGQTTTAANLNAVGYGGSQWAAPSASAPGAGSAVYVSPTGAGWAPRPSGTMTDLSAIAWGNGQWVAVGAAGTVVTSSDGLSWTVQTSGTASNLAGVAYKANASPTVTGQTLSFPKNINDAITVSGADTDGDVLTYSTVSGPAQGSVTWSGATATYSPTFGYTGTDSFTFKANDGFADSSPATISLTLTNSAPSATAQSVTAAKNVGTSITLAGTDANGDSLTYTVVSLPSQGILSGTPPTVTYTPTTGYSGSDSFTFKANDGTVDSAAATVSITVTNTLPVASGQSISTPKVTPKSVTLVATDADGDSLSYSIVTSPSNGAISGTPPSVTYTPNPGYGGSDAFTFKAYDGTGYSNIATVSVTVTNNAPIATAASFVAIKNTNKAYTLAGTDVDGDVLTYSIVTAPLHGSATPTAAGAATGTYAPTNGYCGSDSFTFKVNDGVVASSAATESIMVDCPPVATDQSVSTPKDTPKSITLAATDLEGDSLSFSLLSGPMGGASLSGAPAATWTYTPKTGYCGSDTFTWRANDGQANSGTATVTITMVCAVNRAPVASNQAVTVAKNVGKSFVLAATDPDGDALSYSLTTGPMTGASLTGAPNAGWTYTPATGFSGSDSFTFTANDGAATSNVATVSLTIVNQAPIATGQTISVTKNTIAAIALFATDADPGETLTFAIVAAPTHGTVSSGTGASRTYTPTSGYAGADSFTFSASDGTTSSNTATISLNVVNTVPVATGQSLVVPKNGQSPISLSASDADADSLAYIIVTSPTHGTLTGSGLARTFKPTTGYSGSDSFTFKVNDGSADSNVATVSLTMTNLVPTATAQSASTTVNKAKTILLAGSDGDGDVLSFTIQSSPSYGAISLSGATATYTPASLFAGADSFTFRANDGAASSAPATVSLTIVDSVPVVAADPAPAVSCNQAYPVVQGVATHFPASSPGTRTNRLLANDADADPGDTLTASLLTAPSIGGLLQVFGDGSFSYTSPSSPPGTLTTFVYRATDAVIPTAASATGTVTLCVVPTDVAAPKFVATANGLSVSFQDLPDSYGAAVSWSWDFGDSSTGSGSSPVHAYGGPGTYKVIECAKNPVGTQACSEQTVTVDSTPGPAPVLDPTLAAQQAKQDNSLASLPNKPDAGFDQVALEDAVVHLEGKAAAGTTPVWAQSSGPNVTLLNANTFSPSFVAPAAPAVLSFSLRVSQGGALSQADVVQIAIQAAPLLPVTAHADEASPLPGTTVHLAVDSDDGAQFVWSQISGPTVSLLGSGKNVSFVAPNSVGQVLEFKVVATKGHRTASSTLDIVIRGGDATTASQPVAELSRPIRLSREHHSSPGLELVALVVVLLAVSLRRR